MRERTLLTSGNGIGSYVPRRSTVPSYHFEVIQGRYCDSDIVSAHKIA